jgi:WD domain, G-beta repeat
MSPLAPDSRTPPGAPGEDQPRPEPGRPVRVTILPRGLAALLSGLILMAIYLVPGPEQQEPESLAHLILRGHRGLVNAVAFAPDGWTLASGGEDQTDVLWDLASDGRESRILEHEAPVYALTFAPDGRTLASGATDLTVRLWDVAAGRERAACDGTPRMSTPWPSPQTAGPWPRGV